MRKYFLTAALVIMSATAQAGIESTMYIEDFLMATAVIKDAAMEPPPPVDQLELQMNHMVHQREAFKQALLKFSKYSKSSDPSVQQSYALVTSCLLLQEIAMGEVIKQLEDLMNMPPKDVIAKRGTIAKKFAEAGERVNDGWTKYAGLMGPAATYALLQPLLRDVKNLSDKIDPHLVITRAEMKMLQGRVESLYGAEATRPANTNTPFVVYPAISVYRFLGDNWKGSDER